MQCGPRVAGTEGRGLLHRTGPATGWMTTEGTGEEDREGANPSLSEFRDEIVEASPAKPSLHCSGVLCASRMPVAFEVP